MMPTIQRLNRCRPAMTTTLRGTTYERHFLVGPDASLSAQSHLHAFSDRQQTTFVADIGNSRQFHVEKLRVLAPNRQMSNTVREVSEFVAATTSVVFRIL